MAGMTRQVDDLGRIVIPKEIRRTLQIDFKNSVEFFVDDNKIFLRRYEPGCVICGEFTGGYTMFHGKKVCKECKQKLSMSRNG